MVELCSDSEVSYCSVFVHKQKKVSKPLFVSLEGCQKMLSASKMLIIYFNISAGYSAELIV